MGSCLPSLIGLFGIYFPFIPIHLMLHLMFLLISEELRLLTEAEDDDYEPPAN